MQNIADAFKNLITVTDIVCPIHGTYKIKFKSRADSEPICRQCMEQVKQQEIAERTKELERRRYIELSSPLVDNKRDLEYRFQSLNANSSNADKKLAHEVYDQASYFISNPTEPHKLLLIGKSGTGKTTLASCLASRVNNSGLQPLFVNINALVRHLKRSFNDPEEFYNEHNFTDLASKANLLVIDDLGTESLMHDGVASDWIQKVLYSILETQKRMVITTNLTINQLTKVYNPKIVSRLQESSVLLSFDKATDHRLLNQQIIN